MSYLVDVDGEELDGVGVLLVDLLDVHAALLGDDEDGSALLAVHDDGEVLLVLAAEGDTLVDEDLLDHLALGRGLLGHERVAEHGLSELADLGRVGGEVHTALEASLGEVALATATGVDLGLDDELGSTSGVELVGSGHGLGGGGGDNAGLHANVELVHELLGLVLVEVEVALGADEAVNHAGVKT